MRVIILISFCFLASCSKKDSLGLNLKHLIETSYKKPSSNCRKLANVTGFTLKDLGFARSYEKALDSILKETHASGGNFLYITRASTDGTNLDGEAYACSRQAKN